MFFISIDRGCVVTCENNLCSVFFLTEFVLLQRKVCYV